MFEAATEPETGSILARFHDVVDELLGLSLTGLNGDDVLGVLREVEAEHRRLAVLDHALIAEVEHRGLALERGCASTDRLLRQLLRISIGDAGARTRAARDLGPRRGLTGQALAPIFPLVAAAQAAGDVSPAQARIITRLIDQLPDEVQAEHEEQVQEFLLEQARVFAPEQLSTLAQRLAETLDPDGRMPDERRREASRDLSVRRRTDGSARVEGELTAACAEALLTVLDATARPRPETDGARDTRTPGQRRHDGLLDAVLGILRTGELPQTNGVTTTIILTLTTDQLARHVAGLPAGLVRTGHGAALSTSQALRLCADARVIPVVFGTAKEIVAYGSTQRIFTEGQRLAMIARDLGCSFPACDAPPLWCEAHHVPDHAVSGHTSVDEGTLACGFHHREHQKLGWATVMINGTPHWRPAAWIDPQRRPLRNWMHHPLPEHDPPATTSARDLVAPQGSR